MLIYISLPALVLTLLDFLFSHCNKNISTLTNNRGNLLMHLSCTNGAPYCQKKLREDKKRGTLYLTAEHKLCWFRLLIGEGTFQCLNPIQSFLREVDSCTWEKIMNWLTKRREFVRDKTSILFHPRSGLNCSSSFVLCSWLYSISWSMIKNHYTIAFEKNCNNLLHPDD